MIIGNYNKQQSEMIMFLGVIGMALLIISYLFFIKPCFAARAKLEQESQRIQTEIDTVIEEADKLRLRLKQQQELEEHIAQMESRLFTGLGNSRLVQFFKTIADQEEFDFPINPGYGLERQQTAPVDDYLEVFSTITIKSYDYLKLMIFIKALEQSNSGVRISSLTLRKSESEDEGLVDCDFQFRLMGFTDESDPPVGWKPTIQSGFVPEGLRNPFGVPGATTITVVTADPDLRFHNAVQNIVVTFRWKGYGIVFTRKGSKKHTDWLLNESIKLGGVPVKLLNFSVDLASDYLIIERQDSKERYKLVTKDNGVREIHKITSND